MGSIPLIWWHHLDGNSVSRSCWLFRLSLDRFWPQGPFTLNQILVSTHAPQFWDKIILFQNFPLWPLHALRIHTETSASVPTLGKNFHHIPEIAPISITPLLLFSSTAATSERQTLANLGFQSQHNAPTISMGSSEVAIQLGSASPTLCSETRIHSFDLDGDHRLRPKGMT